jgi:hypothetical protein
MLAEVEILFLMKNVGRCHVYAWNAHETLIFNSQERFRPSLRRLGFFYCLPPSDIQWVIACNVSNLITLHVMPNDWWLAVQCASWTEALQLTTFVVRPTASAVRGGQSIRMCAMKLIGWGFLRLAFVAVLSGKGVVAYTWISVCGLVLRL